MTPRYWHSITGSGPDLEWHRVARLGGDRCGLVYWQQSAPGIGILRRSATVWLFGHALIVEWEWS